MPKILVDSIQPKLGSDYPSPFGQPLAGREARNVGAGVGVEDFNANHVILPPGCWSSQRHWHAGEDELVVILSGKAVLIDDTGRHPLEAGDIAVFPKNDGNGHHLINESEATCVLLAISRPEMSPVVYPDIDLRWAPDTGETHADGSPYRKAT